MLAIDSALTGNGETFWGALRQLVVRGNGHDKPEFLISNDHDAELAVMTLRRGRTLSEVEP